MKPEGSDKTYRQLNMEKTWNIPLNSLVKELKYNLSTGEYVDHPHGMVLRVVRQGRDCDGTPLYYLGSMTAERYEEQMALMRRAVVKVEGEPAISGRYFGPLVEGGYAEESLKVIALPHEIEEDD
jgi:hypothetical protein